MKVIRREMVKVVMLFEPVIEPVRILVVRSIVDWRVVIKKRWWENNSGPKQMKKPRPERVRPGR